MNPYTQRLHDKIDEFLEDWLAWAEGRPHKYNHDERIGLCSNLSGYILGLPEDMQDDIESEFRDLLGYDYCPFDESRQAYVACKAKRRCPFDESRQAYAACKDKRLNPKRLAWVKQRLGYTSSPSDTPSDT